MPRRQGVYCLQLLESDNIIEVHLGLWALGVMTCGTPQLDVLSLTLCM